MNNTNNMNNMINANNYVRYNSGSHQWTPHPPHYAHHHGIPRNIPQSPIYPLVQTQVNSCSIWPSQQPDLYPRHSNGRVRDRIESLEDQNLAPRMKSKTEARPSGGYLPHSKELETYFGDAAHQLSQLNARIARLESLLQSRENLHDQIGSSLEQIPDLRDDIDQTRTSQDRILSQISHLKERLEGRIDPQIQAIRELLASHSHLQAASTSGININGISPKRKGSDRSSSSQAQKHKLARKKVQSEGQGSGGETRRKSSRLASAGSKRIA